MKATDPVARFQSRIAKAENGCWLWQGAGVNGRGQLSVNGKNMLATRFSYQHFKGDIPPGMYVCHTCDNPACFNPDHLFLGDHTANQRDMVAKKRHYRVILTHCVRGHELSGENVFWDHGKRKCKRCCLIRSRIANGWPRDIAESAPPTPRGKRPFGTKWARRRHQRASGDAGESR